MIQFEVYVETVITISLHQTVIGCVCTAQVELCLFRTTAHADIMRLRQFVVSKHFILPVVSLLILIQVQVSERTETFFEAADIRCSAESSTLIVVHYVLIR